MMHPGKLGIANAEMMTNDGDLRILGLITKIDYYSLRSFTLLQVLVNA
jgi:hypothetical protein